MITKETMAKLEAMRNELRDEERTNQKPINYLQTLNFYAKDVERAVKARVASDVIVDAKADPYFDCLTIDFIEGDSVIFHWRTEVLSENILACTSPASVAAAAIGNFKDYILRRYFR